MSSAASGSVLTLTSLTGFPTVASGCDLAGHVMQALSGSGIRLADSDIIVLAQKVVSKAEGRTVCLVDICPSLRAQEMAAVANKDPRVVELILSEAAEVLRCAPGVIIVEDRRGFIMANAGIDASNVEGSEGSESVVLLPIDPDASAARIRAELHARTGVSVGVVINDSFGRAWRLGTVGTAIGAAGLPTLLDLRGLPDRNGRILQSSELAVGDELAAAASLMMGQSNEGRPAVHVRGFPYQMHSGSASALRRPKHMDLFR